MRKFEVFYRELLVWSKLTVTPERVTLKVAPRDGGRISDLIHAAHRVADQIDHPVTLRGRFRYNERNEPVNRIYMTSVNRAFRKTYYWDNLRISTKGER